MDLAEKHGTNESIESLKPMPLVLGTICFAFVASFVVTSLRNYGGFNYDGHSTALSNAIIESMGAAFVLPIIHLFIASFWKAKRNSRTRRNIFFGWGVAIAVIQIFNAVNISGRLSHKVEAESSELIIPQSQLALQPPLSPEIRVQDKVTLESWNRDLSYFLTARSTKTLPDGIRFSVGCVPEVRSDDCVKINIKRQPFERVRLVTPEEQVDLGSPGRSASLLPFIFIRDGEAAELGLFAYVPQSSRSKRAYGSNISATMTEISVVSNDYMIFSRKRNDGLLGLGWSLPRKVGMDGDRSSPAIILSDEDIYTLSKISPNSSVSVRFVLSYLDDQVTINLRSGEAEQFVANFQKTVTAYNMSRGNLTAVGDYEDSGKWLD